MQIFDVFQEFFSLFVSVVKTQFLAIEIARNREGLNSNLRQIYKHDDIPPE